MVNVDMCYHGWPGSGCSECRAEAEAEKAKQMSRDSGWVPDEEPALVRSIAGHEQLYGLLLKRAGLTPDFIARGQIDPEFTAILSALEAIHRGKEVLYGNYLETHSGSPTALVEHFADVKRKWVRVQNFVAKRLNGEKLDYHELMDTFSDMAVYSIMGIQLLRLLIEKERK